MREGVYGPWIVVTRRKNGTKMLRSGGTSPRQSYGIGSRNLNMWIGKARLGLLCWMGLLERPKESWLLQSF